MTSNRSTNRMPRLSSLLREARNRRCVMQTLIAKELSALAGREVSQSHVAQLETGKITNPDFETLTRLEQVYGVSLDRLIAATIEDKYGISYRTTVFLWENAWSMAAFCSWAEGLPNKTTIWIRVRSVFAKSNRELLEVLRSLLARECTLVFFADESDLGRGRDMYIALRILGTGCKAEKERIRVVALPWGQAACLQSFAIANPSDLFRVDGKTKGYLLFDELEETRFFLEWDKVTMQRQAVDLAGLVETSAIPFSA